MSSFQSVLETQRGRELAERLARIRPHGKRRKDWWTRERILAFLRSAGRCEYCGDDLICSRAAFFGAEWDHIVPRDRGGEHAPCGRKNQSQCFHVTDAEEFERNIAVACPKCNSAKSNRLPEQTNVRALLAEQDASKRIERLSPWVQRLRNECRAMEEFEILRELTEMARCRTD
jgi:5-methylcytosine-specific restriction endonuclease McrA